MLFCDCQGFGFTSHEARVQTVELICRPSRGGANPRQGAVTLWPAEGAREAAPGRKSEPRLGFVGGPAKERRTGPSSSEVRTKQTQQNEKETVVVATRGGGDGRHH